MTPLYRFLAGHPEIGYNEENKKTFKSLGQELLKSLVEKLKKDDLVEESKVSFNPGGVAVSGDHSLMLMFKTGKGVYVNISAESCLPDQSFMMRSIKGMKDYSGGTNQWFRFTNLDSIPRMGELLRRFQ